MDWDVRGQELEQYFGRFGHRPMPALGIWALSLACSRMPRHHIGFECWITQVAGVNHFCPAIQRWAVALADHIGVVRIRRRRRFEPFTHTYRPEWGHQAALDGVSIALFGRDNVHGAYTRSLQLDCDKRAYQRVRDFVAGACLLGMNQFREALAQAFRSTAREDWDRSKDFYRVARVQHSSEAHEAFGGNAYTAPLPASDDCGFQKHINGLDY